MDILRRIFSRFTHSCFEKFFSPKSIKGKVLMFHHFGESEVNFNISIAEFEKIVFKLQSLKVIDLSNWENEDDFVAVSIDDVPESFYKYAYPLLKKYNIPFTLFVSTSLIDTEGFITTKQLSEMASDPLCTVGSHGHSHRFVYEFSKDEFLDDLKLSKIMLEGIIGKPVTMYAFPYGSVYACGFIKKYLVKEVYKYGFGTIAIPFATKNILPKYFLPRINVDSTNFLEVL